MKVPWRRWTKIQPEELADHRREYREDKLRNERLLQSLLERFPFPQPPCSWYNGLQSFFAFIFIWKLPLNFQCLP